MLNANFFSQDTIQIESKTEFESIIHRSYADGFMKIPSNIYNSIDSIFRLFDFEKPKFECQYKFYISLKLDSCGYIVQSVPLKDDKLNHPELILFQTKVSEYLSNNFIQIKNVFHLTDTTLRYYESAIFFGISCDQPTVDLLIDERIYNATYVYRSDDKLIYFNGPINDCK